MDKESRLDPEEPADKQAELFDLHVMMFADSSTATAAALQQAFAIDRAMAEKMLSQVPIVVKRAADPQVAAALLDVLQSLGAQVVLLPSAGAPPRIEHKPGEPALVPAPVWGGLDLEPRAVVAAQPAGAPAAASWQRGSWPSRGSSGPSSLPAPNASVIPIDRRSEIGAPTGMASRAEDFVSGSEADLSEPPELPEIPPLFDERSDEREEPALELEHPVAATRRSPFAPRPVSPGPPSLDATRMPRVTPPVHPDLGLGTVPPLPSVSMVRAAPAPVRPAPSRRGAEPGRAVGAPEPMRVDRAPPLALAKPPEPVRVDRAAASPVRSAGSDSYWSGRRSPSSDADEPSSPSARVAPRPARESDALDGDFDARPQAPQAVVSSKPVEPRSRGLALLQLLAGVLVFALGVHFDNSVLHGNATLVSVAAHGLALYGVGAGIAGLWP